MLIAAACLLDDLKDLDEHAVRVAHVEPPGAGDLALGDRRDAAGGRPIRGDDGIVHLLKVGQVMSPISACSTLRYVSEVDLHKNLGADRDSAAGC